MATVVAVVGTIAGAGTTTVVTALGTALGEQRRQVAIIDATAEGSRLTDAIGLKGGGEVTDALRRRTAVSEAKADAPHDVAAFPAGPETSWGAVRPDAVDDLYDQLRDRFEFVLVDCGNEPSVDRAAWLGHADEVVVVTDPDVAGAVPEIVALADAFDVPVRGVLASRVPLKEVGDAIDALGETDQTVLGVLPEDPTVGAAAEAGTSVLRTEPDSPIATCAWEFALRFPQSDHDEPVVPAGTVPESMEHADGDSDGASETERDREPGVASNRESEETAAGETAAEEPTDEPTETGTGTADESPPGGTSPSETPSSRPGDDAVSSDEEAGAGSRDGEELMDQETAVEGTASLSTAEDRAETPDPQPVEERGPSGREREGSDSGAQTSAGEAGGASTPDPSRAAARSSIRESGSEGDSVSGDGASEDATIGDESDEGQTSGFDGIDLGFSDDREIGNDEATEDGETDAVGDSRADSDLGIGVDDGGEDAEAAGTDDESAELSDEEIESVFQETMQRVKDRREQEEAERDE